MNNKCKRHVISIIVNKKHKHTSYLLNNALTVLQTVVQSRSFLRTCVLSIKSKVLTSFVSPFLLFKNKLYCKHSLIKIIRFVI